MTGGDLIRELREWARTLEVVQHDGSEVFALSLDPRTYRIVIDKRPGTGETDLRGDLLDTLKAAVARVELANKEGNPILSAWLPEAQAIIAKAEGSDNASEHREKILPRPMGDRR
jgi:hypothetical protein